MWYVAQDTHDARKASRSYLEGRENYGLGWLDLALGVCVCVCVCGVCVRESV